MAKSRSAADKNTKKMSKPSGVIKKRTLSNKTSFKFFKKFLIRHRESTFEDVYALFFKQLKARQWAQNMYEQFKQRESGDSPKLNPGHQHDDVWSAFNQLYLWDKAELNGENLWRPSIVAIYTGEGADSVNGGEPFSLKSGRSSPDSGFKDGDSRSSSAMGSSFLSEGGYVDAVKREEDHSQYMVIGGGHEMDGEPSKIDDLPSDYLSAVSNTLDGEGGKGKECVEAPTDLSPPHAMTLVSGNVSSFFEQYKDSDRFARSTVQAGKDC